MIIVLISQFEVNPCILAENHDVALLPTGKSVGLFNTGFSLPTGKSVGSKMSFNSEAG